MIALYLIHHYRVFSSVGLWYIVQRTKLCLDFSCTVHILHLVRKFAKTSEPHSILMAGCENK